MVTHRVLIYRVSIEWWHIECSHRVVTHILHFVFIFTLFGVSCRDNVVVFKKFASLSNFILSDVRFSCQVPLLVTRRGDTFFLTKLPASEACIHHSRRICTWFADARTAAPWCKATGFKSHEFWLIVSGDSIPTGSLYTVCLIHVCTCTSYTHIYMYTHTDAGIQYDGNCLGLHWFRSIVKYDLQVVSVLKTSTQTRVCMQTFSPLLISKDL